MKRDWLDLEADLFDDGVLARAHKKEPSNANCRRCTSAPLKNSDLIDERIEADRVLVVDDDPEMRQLLISFLMKYDYLTGSASNRRELYQEIARARPSLILLDLALGDENGLDYLRELPPCRRADIPVVIITGRHLDEVDRITGLELGADDYIGKPFNLWELLARVRAVLRRRKSGRVKRGYRFGGWHLTCSGKQLVDPNGTTVRLIRSEYSLLLAFLERPQRNLSREQLLEATRMGDDVIDRSIDLRVLRLRRKLGRIPGEPRMITTVRGLGYYFELEVKPIFEREVAGPVFAAVPQPKI